MLLGVVSDTHGYMDPRVAPLLQGVDHIIHAGDIGKGDIIGQLSLIAPVTAVRGNNDHEPPESEYPEEVTLNLQGCRIYLTHQVKVPKSRRQSSPQTLVGSRHPGSRLWSQPHRPPETGRKHPLLQPRRRRQTPLQHRPPPSGCWS